MCRESPDVFVQIVFQVLQVLLGSSYPESVFQREWVPVGHSGAAWQELGQHPIRAASSVFGILSLFCLGTSGRYQ